MKISRSTRILLAAALLANVLAAGAYTLLFLRVKEKNENLSSLQGKIQVASRKEEKIAAIKETLAETALLRQSLASYFVDEDGIVNFINLIETFATENNLIPSIKNVEQGGTPSKEAGEFTEGVRLTVEVKGSGRSVFHFLSLLETLPLHISFEQVSLESIGEEAIGKKGDTTPLWRGVIRFTVLQLKGV
ncbi:MAG: hypothetical protein G01um101472_345 [Parcubacteria group bacterium Gr01-1014_72]|nr:MAG: hypothetical protein G01um101472_345 [Parcubacteria group bacterium Gr01-1014_72]